jgi:hypothetical protein
VISVKKWVLIMSDANHTKYPSAFLSYAWENDTHKDWVRNLAVRLRADGINIMLDQWETAPGDQLPEFMERSVRENDFVLIVCTPKYKLKSDERSGGVGYEGDIMTGELFATRNRRKFIPILRIGTWQYSAPSWLLGTYYVDLRGDPYSETHFRDLTATLLKQRPSPPQIGERMTRDTAPTAEYYEPQSFEPLNIIGIVVDEVTIPKNDGTRGSALYTIPFQLSQRPTSEWSQVFVTTWNHPPRFTTMHRPGIASIIGDKVILDGTTIEEVEEYHRDTLKLVVDRTNEIIAEYEQKKRKNYESEQQRIHDHRKRVDEVSKRLKFD